MLIKLSKTFTLSELTDLGESSLRESQDLSTSFQYLTTDSRDVTQDTLFVALGRGVDYIPTAIEHGASAVLHFDHDLISHSIPHLQFNRQAVVLPKILNFLFDSPAENLRVIGVTGTNGKTSINWMIYEACNLLQSKAMRVGTLGIATQEKSWPGDYTTPDLLSNYYYLQEALKGSCENFVIEVSSHALAQDRVLGIDFDVAIYTNLTRDHFDYHGNYENYFLAKKKLFESLIHSSKPKKVAIINQDCPYSAGLMELLQNTNVQIVTIGRTASSNLQILPSHQTAKGADYHFSYQGQDFKFHSKIIGKFNEENLAVVLAFVAEHYGMEKILDILPQIRPVPGRLEPISNSKLSTFVDYAHTPDALENALTTLRLITPKDSKLWVVFGCGGDRDKGKRPLMGEIASKFADRVVVTSDNPRTEDAEQIIQDISEGISADFIQVDRELAIQQTLAKAEMGDLILIAGKGHEDYQEINKTKYPFSDQLIIRKFLQVI